MEEIVRKLVREQLEQVLFESEYQEIEMDMGKIAGFKSLYDVKRYLSKLYQVATGEKPLYFRTNIDGVGTGPMVKNPALFADILNRKKETEELTGKKYGKAPITDVAYVAVYFRQAKFNLAVSGI